MVDNGFIKMVIKKAFFLLKFNRQPILNVYKIIVFDLINNF